MGKRWRQVARGLGIHLFLRGMQRWHPIVRMLIGGMIGAWVGMGIGIGIVIAFAPARTGVHRIDDISGPISVIVGASCGLVIGGIFGATAGLFRSWADRACILGPALGVAVFWMAVAVLSYEKLSTTGDQRAVVALHGFIFGGGLGFIAGLVLVPIMRHRVLHY